MIREALEFLSDAFVGAEKPVRLETFPRKDVWAHRGMVSETSRPIPPRSHHAASLAEVASLANRFHSEGSKPVVWYDEDGVTLVIDDDGHRVETATLDLDHSDIWKTLTKLRDGKPTFDPKKFARLLRVGLAGTLEPFVLLNHVRKLKFINASSLEVTTGRGKESMGKEINAEVSTAADIPETVVLTAPVFKTPGETDAYAVRCAVEIDPMEGTLQLLPLPDELERVEQLAVASIAERLSEKLNKEINFYQGKP